MYDAYYDNINNKYSYYFYCSIKQYDTHVYFDLYEYIVEKNSFNDYNSKMVEKRLILNDIILTQEHFLGLISKNMFLNDRTIVKDKDLRWFIGNIKKIQFPSKYYIGSLTKKEISRMCKAYDYILNVRSIDNEYVLFDFSILNKGYYMQNVKLSKPLFEKLAHKIRAIVNYATDFSELYHSIQNLNFKIKKPLFSRHYNDINNCFHIINTSPTSLTYSNIFKILSPTVEGLLRDYFDIKQVNLEKKRDLGQIINEINTNNYFSKDEIELISLIHQPLRNYASHGHVSENLARLSVFMIFEIYEMLYHNMYE